MNASTTCQKSVACRAPGEEEGWEADTRLVQRGQSVTRWRKVCWWVLIDCHRGGSRGKGVN